MDDSGTVAHVVCNDPAAHLELIELCQKWHARSPNSMFIDGESSQYSYQKLTGRRLAQPQPADAKME